MYVITVYLIFTTCIR